MGPYALGASGETTLSRNCSATVSAGKLAFGHAAGRLRKTARWRASADGGIFRPAASLRIPVVLIVRTLQLSVPAVVTC